MSERPIVFVGPAIAKSSPALFGQCELRAPIRRGELDRLVGERAAGTVVLVEGFFGASLAVTPTECRDALRRGWTVVGASSIGALRAAELWSVGMIGIGTIFDLLRLGVIQSDAEASPQITPKVSRKNVCSRTIRSKASISGRSHSSRMVGMHPYQ